MGSLLEVLEGQKKRPKSKSSKSKSSKSRKTSPGASMKPRNASTASTASSTRVQEPKEIIYFPDTPYLSGISLRCKDRGVSLFIESLSREMVFAGEAMSQVWVHMCQKELQEDGERRTEISPMIASLVSEMLRLATGALMFSALAVPRDGGCDVSAKMHGASVPLNCRTGSNYLQARIGGAGSGTSRQGRPGFEVIYIVTSDELDNTPVELCDCKESRNAFLEVAWALMSCYAEESVNKGKDWFSRAMYLIDGLTGRYPIGDGSETMEEFGLKHVGGCFRQSLESGEGIPRLMRAVERVRSNVQSAKLLVSWDLEDSNWEVSGVLIEFYNAFAAMVYSTQNSINEGTVAPDRLLCTLPQPSAETVAEEAADPTSAKSLALSMRNLELLAETAQSPPSDEPADDGSAAEGSLSGEAVTEGIAA